MQDYLSSGLDGRAPPRAGWAFSRAATHEMQWEARVQSNWERCAVHIKPLRTEEANMVSNKAPNQRS